MKHSARMLMIVVIALVGCLQPASVPSPPGPAAPTTLDAVTIQATREYLRAMADLCDKTAADIDAGKYKAQSQVTDQFKGESANLRIVYFAKIGARFDKDVTPGVALEQKKTADAYRRLGLGFRGAVK